MKFQTAPANRSTRVIAALVILSLGVGILLSTPMPAAIAGTVLAAIAGVVLCSELWTYCRERWNRRDPYDLSLLDDAPIFTGPSRDDPGHTPAAPSWASEAEDTVYCHRCDVSMPAAYSTCPKCGTLLGH